MKIRMYFAGLALAVLMAPFSHADLLFDQAVHTPGATGGTGSSAIFGELSAGNVFDRQFADDFTVGGALPWLVNRVDSSWIPFTSADPNPVTGMNVAFYNRTPGGSVGTLVASAVGTITRTTGPGTYFDRPEQILRADFADILLAPGDYFVSLQPVVDHNWFWLTSADNPNSPAHFRRGPGASAGVDVNWSTDWTVTGTAGSPFETAQGLNFAIHGMAVPEPGSIAVLCIGLVVVASRRFRV